MRQAKSMDYKNPDAHRYACNKQRCTCSQDRLRQALRNVGPQSECRLHTIYCDALDPQLVSMQTWSPPPAQSHITALVGTH